MSSAAAESQRVVLAGIAGLVIALCIALAAIFWQLADKSLLPDEAFYYNESLLPIPQLLDYTARANFHPPLFYLAFHYIDAVLHLPPPDHRYFTAPFGLLTVVAAWALARRWFGSLTAAVTAVIVATEPLLISEDHLFRMYGVVVALAVASWWFLIAAESASGWQRRLLWIWYGVCAIAMPYTLYLGGLVVAAQALYALWRRGPALPALAWAAAAGVALIPWSWAIKIQLPHGGFPGAAVSWWSVAPGALLFTPPRSWDSLGFDIAVTLGALALIVSGCWLGRRTALPFMFVPGVLQIVLSLALHNDFVVDRFLALSVPPFAIAVGALSWSLLGARRWVAGVAVPALILAGNTVALANFLFDPYYQTTDWYAVEIAMHGQAQPGDMLVFDQWGPYLVLRASPDVRNHLSYEISQSVPPDGAVPWVDSRPDARVWYVENLVESWDPRRLVWQHLRATRPLLYSYSQMHAAPANNVLLQLYGPAARKTAP